MNACCTRDGQAPPGTYTFTQMLVDHQGIHDMWHGHSHPALQGILGIV
jgi:hypothetical protein